MMIIKPELDENQIATVVVDSARQIWLAGLGAFAKAEREGGKFFETLIVEGEKLEARIKKVSGKKVEYIKDKAADTWNKLEEVFQKRVARALSRLGVPTSEDIRLLLEQVEALEKNIKELEKLEELNLKIVAEESAS
jgi:poly(hydroxyalkanoate) granule-associated protein